MSIDIEVTVTLSSSSLFTVLSLFKMLLRHLTINNQKSVEEQLKNTEQLMTIFFFFWRIRCKLVDQCYRVLNIVNPSTFSPTWWVALTPSHFATLICTAHPPTPLPIVIPCYLWSTAMESNIERGGNYRNNTCVLRRTKCKQTHFVDCFWA